MAKILKYSIWMAAAVFIAALLFPSCKREQFTNDPSAKLGFSTDTVMFDTVFTVLGGGPFPRSVNKRLITYNRNKQSIKTSIRLMGGTASPYRINIDGERTTQLADFEIMGKDSIYIFVEVSIDPLNGADPVIHDSIEFVTNGNTQYVQLRAFGIDAHYFNDSVLACNTVWNDKTKPYVIYNSVLVPPNCKLTIGDGVKIYSDVNSYLYVQGTLEVNGTKTDRVKFQGGRLGEAFTKLPGQWGGIHFLTTSKDSYIRYADIVNGIVGVRSDSLPLNTNPKVLVENTLISNMSAVGVLAYTSKVRMVNCCVNNCGQYTFAGDLGGTYEMTHCTFANFAGTFSRKDPSFALSNADYNNLPNTLSFTILNSIIYGNLREELYLYRGGQGTVTGVFEANILKTQLLGFSSTNKINIDPKFKNITDLDFSLDTLSPAKDAAPFLVSTDLKGEIRDAQPDIGAYERKE